MANLTKFKKILILRGGISDELEISRLTANQVFETIKPFGDVEIIDVTRDSGKLFLNFSKLDQILYLTVCMAFLVRMGKFNQF